MFKSNGISNKTLVPIKIIATGVALPPDKLEAAELDKRLNKPIGYSFKRSGILYRYHADNHLQQANLAAKAIDDALIRCDIAAKSIDLLISACALPVQALPYTAAHILKASSLPKTIASFDVNASCVSFIGALQVAAGLLNTGVYKRIAIVSADLASRGLDWQDEESSLIFGDGAACAIVEQGDGRSGILSCLLETHTTGIDLCEIRGGGSRRNLRTGMDDSDYLFRMKGKPLFRLASSLIEPYLTRLLNQANLTLSDIATVIPHQASHLSLEHMRKRLNVTNEALIDIYRFRGNQVSASIPSALHEAIITQRFNPGEPAMLIGTAAGLTLGGMILLP